MHKFHSHVYTVRAHVSFICMYDTFCFIKKPNHQKEKKNNLKLKLFPLHSITLRNRNDKYPNIKDLKTTSFNIPPEVEKQSSQRVISQSSCFSEYPEYGPPLILHSTLLVSLLYMYAVGLAGD